CFNSEYPPRCCSSRQPPASRETRPAPAPITTQPAAHSPKSPQALRFRSSALVIDAIFGTGLNAPVAGLPARIIEHLNRLETPRLAVDIASGVNADTGAIMGVAARAARTVTFGVAKFGHFSYPGAAHCGDLEIAEIGFAPKAFALLQPHGCLYERAEAARLLRPRPAASHK